MLLECCCMKDSFGSSLQRNHKTARFNISSQILHLSSLTACIADVNREGIGRQKTWGRRGRNLSFSQSASFHPHFAFPTLFNAHCKGYPFDHFKYSYKAILWQASWTFTDWQYEMSGIWSIFVLWLIKNPTNSYLIFDAASRNKPWSNSIARSKAPSVISPEIISLKQQTFWGRVHVGTTMYLQWWWCPTVSWDS